MRFVKDGSRATMTKYACAPGTGSQVKSGIRPVVVPRCGRR
jgi:hypothetical protein